MSNSAIFEQLWQDSKYIALHARKNKIGAAWRAWQTLDAKEAAKRKAAYCRVVDQILKYEQDHGVK